MEEQTFLGTGMKFPPQVSPATGRFVSVSGDESIRESIYLILMTRKGERAMRPDFGSSASDYVFTDTNAAMQNLMTYELETDIAANEPRVEDVFVRMDFDTNPDCLLIDLAYRVKGRNTRENMVFPFYLEQNGGLL